MSDIDFPFCILWANENRTCRWDGSEREVLIEQRHRRTAGRCCSSIAPLNRRRRRETSVTHRIDKRAYCDEIARIQALARGGADARLGLAGGTLAGGIAAVLAALGPRAIPENKSRGTL